MEAVLSLGFCCLSPAALRPPQHCVAALKNWREPLQVMRSDVVCEQQLLIRFGLLRKAAGVFPFAKY